jgi:hypothetical protein
MRFADGGKRFAFVISIYAIAEKCLSLVKMNSLQGFFIASLRTNILHYKKR